MEPIRVTNLLEIAKNQNETWTQLITLDHYFYKIYTFYSLLVNLSAAKINLPYKMEEDATMIKTEVRI